MVTAQTARKIAFAAITVSVLAGALVFVPNAGASAGSPQECTVSSSCTVGEFLYDDSYVPITTATCTITSRYPDGSLHLNGQAMTSAADGWYYHTFTAPTTTGHYRSQVCCTAGTDYLCLDKSFEVKSASSTSAPSTGDISTAVWEYSSRTLSSFGDLVSNVWSNTSRSLTSLYTGDESKIDMSGIETTVNENRLLLEQLVNQPIIQNFIEEEETPSLSEKLDQTKSISNTLYVNSQYLRSKSSLLISKWSKLDEGDVLASVIELSGMLGDEGDSNTKDTIFGQINWLKEAWGWKETESVYEQAIALKGILSATQYRLGSYGKTNYAYTEAKSLLAGIDRLEVLVGDSADSSRQRTLFGKIKEVKDLADIFETRKEDIDGLLAKWDSSDSKSLVSKINGLFNKVIAVNKLPNANKVLSKSSYKDDEKTLKNTLLSLKGLIQANEISLAKKAGSTVSNTWLELGSIVFKSLITNPSNLISQSVPLKYYLPPEIKEENIIKTDDDVEVKYDAEKDQYYIEGEFTLAAGQTRTVSIEVEDIWVITQDEVDSMRKQAEELSRPLENTSYFAQGVTLKSDIDVSLDKIVELQKTSTTPEAKIRAYREALIEMEAVGVKMEKLQELTTQAGSVGTLFGFVGGTQTLAVWGMIIIITGGFVFLAVYMKTLRDKEASKGKKKSKKTTETKDSKQNGQTTNGEARRRIRRRQVAIRLATLFIFFGAGIAALTAFVTSKVLLSRTPSQEVAIQDESLVLGDQEEIEKDFPGKIIEEEVEEEAVGGEDIVMVEVPPGSSINVREEPSLTAKVIDRFKVTQEVIRVGEEEDWVNIAFVDEKIGDYLEGWVYSEFVTEGMPYEDLGDDLRDEFEKEPLGGMILIGETPTGWLRVRETPGGTEIDKVDVGEIFALMDENSGWFQIELSTGELGWVSKEYALLEK